MAMGSVVSLVLFLMLPERDGDEAVGLKTDRRLAAGRRARARRSADCREPMKTRAAVAFAAKQPLEIVELDLEGPKAGEVLVEIMATGICHTDAYTLDGLDSEGIFPIGARPRGRRDRARGRARA